MKRFALTTVAIAIATVGFSQNYTLKSITAQRLEVTRAFDFHPDQEAIDIVAPYKLGVDSIMSPVLGVSDMVMAARRPESPLSNLFSDILRESAKKYGFNADIGICNMGGLRAPLPKGNVTVGNILAIAPFDNKLCFVTMQGKDLLTLFQEIAKNKGEGISGATLQITNEGELVSAMVGDKAIKPSKIYKIATLDYLAEGNDGMVSFKKSISKQIEDIKVSDVYMNYIQSITKQGKTLSAKEEGRILVDGKTATEYYADTPKKYKDVTLQIVHTNDTHSCIEPLGSSAGQNADKAGYMRRSALLQDIRAVDPEILLLDCGDFSQGSAYYNLYKGEVEVKLMNHMKYDAATIGNHEFDFGIDNMVRLFKMAKFPILCCNYDFSNTPLNGIVKPYTIIEKKGIKIGLIGVCPKLDGLVTKANYGEIVYNDPIACANPIAKMLKEEEHCDLVIVLSHLGWLVGLSDSMNDQTFISQTRNIDVVLGGHSHTYFSHPEYVNNLDGKPIICNQMGKNAQWVGTLKLNMQVK